MIPSKSNLSKDNCSQISSNCVIWQGPDISCIKLCNGDTISDVTFKVATEICKIQDDLDLSDLDLTCLVNICTNCTNCDPEKTLANILELLITKVCCLADIVGDGTPDSLPYSEPTLELPDCLQFTENGSTVTQLVHSEYTLHLAEYICQLNATVNQHTSQITNLTTAVTTIQNWKVTPSCAYPTTIPAAGTPTPILTFLEAFEDKMCTITNLLGTVTQINDAIGAICTGLNTKPSLSGSGQMQNIAGWNNPATTLAQSIENLWITVCDMRDKLEDCDCGTTTGSPCDDIDLSGIEGTVVLNAGGSSTITMDYSSLAGGLPSGATACAGAATLNFTDAGGATIPFVVNLFTTPSTVTYNLPASFNVCNGLNAVLIYCIRHDDVSCEGEFAIPLEIPCGQIGTINNITLVNQ